MLDDDKKWGNFFPTRTGTPIGGAGERQMAAKLGNFDTPRTVIRNNPDGSQTMLKTGAGLGRYITTGGGAVDAVQLFISFAKNIPMLNVASSTNNPTVGKGQQLIAATSCDGLFHLLQKSGTTTVTPLKVVVDKVATPYTIKVEYTLGTLINMPVPKSNGAIATWGNPWHGPIDANGVVTLPNGSTKTVVGVLSPNVTLVDFGATAQATLPVDQAAGMRWDNYALLWGAAKNYGIDGWVSLGEDSWLFKDISGVVWQARLTFSGANATVGVRPVEPTPADWTTIATQAVPTISASYTEGVFSHSKDGAITIHNLMVPWFKNSADTGFDTSTRMVAAARVLRVDLVSGSAGQPPTASVSTLAADTGYAFNASSWSGSWPGSDFESSVSEPNGSYERPNLIRATNAGFSVIGYTTVSFSRTTRRKLVAKLVTPEGVVTDMDYVTVSEGAGQHLSDGYPAIGDPWGEVVTPGGNGSFSYTQVDSKYFEVGATSILIEQRGYERVGVISWHYVTVNSESPDGYYQDSTGTAGFTSYSSIEINGEAVSITEYGNLNYYIRMSGNNVLQYRLIGGAVTQYTKAISLFGSTQTIADSGLHAISVNPKTGEFNLDGSFV